MILARLAPVLRCRQSAPLFLSGLPATRSVSVLVLTVASCRLMCESRLPECCLAVAEALVEYLRCEIWRSGQDSDIEKRACSCFSFFFSLFLVLQLFNFSTEVDRDQVLIIKILIPKTIGNSVTPASGGPTRFVKSLTNNPTCPDSTACLDKRSLSNLTQARRQKKHTERYTMHPKKIKPSRAGL